MHNTELLNHFVDLKIQAKKIDEEIELIKNQVQAEVEKILAEQGGEIEQVALQSRDRVSLSLSSKKTWVYSDFVQKSEEALKERKKEEQQNGEATFTEEKILRVNLPKEE